MNSIIRAKTSIPRVGADELERRRLTARLDAVTEAGCRAVLIEAAAGSGKTTLVAQWARERAASGDSVAWISLDPSDNSPGRFWDLVAEALEPSDSVAWERPSPVPAAPAAPAARTEWLDTLLDRAGGGARRCALVLDNCEHLHDAGLLLEVDYAVQRAPQGFTVVLCGRQLPELDSLYRLDLNGALGRVGQDDLTLRRREIARLFSPACPDADVLLDATEGWPAAVVLAHAMGGAEVTAAAVTSSAPYLDRLCGQLFRSFPGEVRAALAVMALIEPFTADDLRAALASTDAPRVFDVAVRTSGLVVAADTPGSFRLHRLLSRWLLDGGSGAAAVDGPLVHARMARRRLRQDRHAEALAHAGKADDIRLLRDVAAVSGLHLLWSNDLAALDSILRGLATVESAELGLLDSLLSLANGDPGAARIKLEHADHPGDLTAPFGALRTGLEAYLLLARGLPEEALEHLRGVGTVVLPPDVGLFVSNVLSAALIAAAHLDEADDAARAGVAAADERDNPGARIDAHIARAALTAAREDFVPATRDAWTAVREGERQRLRYSPRLRPAHLIIAWGAYHQLDDDAARVHNAFVVSATTTPPMVAHSASKLGLILSFASSPKPAEVALGLLDKVRFDLMHGAQPQDLAVCSLQVAEMMLSLRRADDLTMLKVDQRRYQGISGELQVISAWEHLLAGQLNRSRQLLAPVTSEYVKSESAIGMMTALAMLARLELLENRPFKAREALERALTLAAERGTVRGIGFAGETVRSALQRDRHHYPRFTREVDLLVKQRRRPVQEISGPPLTPREIELVALLPTFATVDELAMDLQISTNTVKTHLRGIYRKLGVGTRREAIAAADKLGLLAPTPVPLRVLRSVSAR